MQKETKEIVNEITQGMINANNKYYEERKIAKQEISDAMNKVKYYLYYFCNDVFLERSIRGQLDIIKENMCKM